MSDTITVHLRGLTGTLDLVVPNGASVEDAINAAQEQGAPVSPDLDYRSGGASLDRGDPVEDGQTITAAPAAVKQGR